MPIVIAACSNRKKIEPARILRAASVPEGALLAVASSWTGRVRAATKRVRADALYCGRSFVEAKAAARRLGADFYIVSAGLGLVRESAKIPPYSATIVGSSRDNVLGRISDGKGAPALAEWWRALTRRSPVGNALNAVVRQSSGLILIALPSAYLAMLAGDLVHVHGRSLRRVRIFTGAVPEALPEKLRHLVMPYDDRFDGPDSDMRGTRTDFASRALRHFVDRILQDYPDGDLAVHARAVRTALQGLRKAPVHARLRRSDAELINLIRKHWKEADGKSGRMLRVLRDDLGIACEQSRFVKLFAKTERIRARNVP
jgi:hypothetical protein